MEVSSYVKEREICFKLQMGFCQMAVSLQDIGSQSDTRKQEGYITASEYSIEKEKEKGMKLSLIQALEAH
jgi:hypothetical protein